MPNKKKPYKKNYYNKPKQHNTVETNSVVDSTAPKNEFNSYSTQQLYNYFFGTNILKIYSPKQIEAMVSDPMSYSKELREISEMDVYGCGWTDEGLNRISLMIVVEEINYNYFASIRVDISNNSSVEKSRENVLDDM